jgi:hypothetical protein
MASVVIIRPAMDAAFCTRHGFTRALLGLRPNRTLVPACAAVRTWTLMSPRRWMKCSRN